MSLSKNYRADPAILSLGNEFYDSVKSADFPKTLLRYRNNEAAKSIGLSHLDDEAWIEHFARFVPLPDNIERPLALRYHGHQFQQYNANLGDGRGFLFAQMRDNQNRLMDLGTKGSGQTPYSRQGDGRLTLLGGVREALATHYLDYLGVPTSQTLSLIETGEDLMRQDEPSPTRSAVMVRLQHSHIRFGTFQRQAFFQNTEALEQLVDYCITHFYPNVTGPQGLLKAVCKRSANMVASWMAGGFVHGVMNTDNMNITGETFDFGPYRFLETLKSGYTAAYFDHNGLYAFARQPEAMYWNLAQLAQSLSLICEDSDLLTALQSFAPHYRKSLRHHVFRRLGIEPKDIENDVAFIMQMLKWLEESQVPWPQFWHDWCGGASREKIAKASPNKDYYSGDAFEAWFSAYKRYEGINTGPEAPIAPNLLYDEIGALWAPIDERDDWSLFEQKLMSFSKNAIS